MPAKQDANECSCGNPEFGFNCMCDWMKKHPGNIGFCCVYCGIYYASKARCSECEAGDTMKAYTVEVEVTNRHTIEVDAEDEQDVVEKVRDMDECDIVNEATSNESVSVEVQNIEEIEKEENE